MTVHDRVTGPGSRTALATRFDALLLDLDGVVYVGPHAVPGAAQALAWARQAGVACGFITNNASRTADVVAEHLTRIGVPARSDEVITSPQAAVSLLADFVDPGAAVLVIGGPGIADELLGRGYRPVRTLEDDPRAVVQGFSPDLSWRDLATATFAVRSGLPWIATNLDFTFPTPEGAAPGNGAMVRMVADVAGREPDAVAGKPEPPLLREAIGRLGAERPLMVGDRLDTDIEAGARVGIPTLAVMTGVTSVAELLRAPEGLRPVYIGADLRVLTEAYDDVVLDPGPPAVATCGAAVARAVEGRLELSGASVDMTALRAACALAWATADAGIELRIDGVIPELEAAVASDLAGDDAKAAHSHPAE